MRPTKTDIASVSNRTFQLSLRDLELPRNRVWYKPRTKLTALR